MNSIIHKIHTFKSKNINLVDIAVVFIILIIIGFFLYNRFSKKTIWIDTQILMSDPEVWWGGESPQYWLVNELEKDMVAYNSFGDEVAIIKNVQDFSIGSLNRVVYVDVSLKAVEDKVKGVYLYNYRPLQKGQSFSLTFGVNNVSGVITGINSLPVIESKKVKFKVSAVDELLIDDYKVGLKALNSQGESIAEITKINKIERSTVKPIDIKKNELFIQNGNLFDITMEVEISTIKDVSGYSRYLNGAEIKLGADVWFQFTELIAQSTIIEILD
jgi:hypothetical protein